MKRRSGVMLAALTIGAVVLGALVVSDRTREVPDFAAVRAAHPASESRLLDRHGRLLHERRTDPTRRRGQWTPLAAISPRLRDTVVALEDRRFPRHAGVDWLAIAAALRDGLRGRPRGASTITMQVAAQIEPALRAGKRRSLTRKWRQITAARAVERRWSKAEILEAYLNLASYRGEIAGIDAAARALFGKAPVTLDADEALLLAVSLRSPNAAPSRVAVRACRHTASSAACERLTRLALTRLTGVPTLTPAADLAPHVARRLLRGGDATRTTTLDARLQRFALDSLARQLRQLAPRNVHDGAVLAVDNRSGEVLIYVGNGGVWSSARHVDGIRAPRQAGSTLKPFLYALAVEQRLLTAASLLEDSPINLETPTGLYVPQNYDHRFRGMLSLRASLAGSLNVPAVRTLMLLGPDAFVTRLRELGFDGVDRDGDYYGYALALGAPEVTLWQLVNAYRTLANGGLRSALSLEPGDVAAPPSTASPAGAMRAAAAFVIGDVLADRDARSASFGVDNAMNLPFWAAVKTGTSKQMRDNWCIGYTARYTVGVWIGNFDGTPMWGVSGLSGAAPVWAEVISQLQAADPGTPPRPPAAVERVPVRFAGTGEPPREEWFLRGTATRRIEQTPPARRPPRIIYPGNGSILVIDPDIPSRHQRVFLASRPSHAAYTWTLDGTPLAATAWAPQPGHHTLDLIDEDGLRVDRVRFAVRGTPLP